MLVRLRFLRYFPRFYIGFWYGFGAICLCLLAFSKIGLLVAVFICSSILFKANPSSIVTLLMKITESLRLVWGFFFQATVLFIHKVVSDLCFVDVLWRTSVFDTNVASLRDR